MKISCTTRNSSRFRLSMTLSWLGSLTTGSSPKHVERFQHALVGLLDEVGHAAAHVGRDFHAPGLAELLAHGRVGDFLVAGQDAVNGPHVAPALDVVLAAERVDARGGLADLAAEHGQVRHVLHVLRAAGMLGDAQRVEDGRRVSLGIHLGGAGGSCRPQRRRRGRPLRRCSRQGSRGTPRSSRTASRTNVSSCHPCAMMWFIIALTRKLSVPGVC